MNFKTVSFGLLMSLLMLNGEESNECTHYQVMETGKTYYAYNPNYPNKTTGENHCLWELKSSHTIKINCSIDIPPSASNDCTKDSISIQFDGREPQKFCGKGEIIDSGKNVNIKFDAQHESKFLCQMTTIPSDNCSCGWKNPTKIVGGKETGVNEYPMMAGLVNFDTRELYCGATIVNNEYVVTAAHCVIEREITKIGVVVGEHNVTTGSETNATKLYRIKWCKIHPYYNSSDRHDIAVCKINGSIKYSNKVGPVCLPFQHHCDSFGGAIVTDLGWGLLEFGGAKSNVLQEVEVNVITTRDCKPYYETNDLDCIMCTYTPNKDACQMDSGGPVLWENPTTHNIVLVGIISAGSGCASKEPALNTRVGCYVDWIKGVTGVDFCEVE